MPDSLKAAHDAGYLHGLIAGGLVFGITCTLLTGVVLSWFMLRDAAAAPDPEAVFLDPPEQRADVFPLHPANHDH